MNGMFIEQNVFSSTKYNFGHSLPTPELTRWLSQVDSTPKLWESSQVCDSPMYQTRSSHEGDSVDSRDLGWVSWLGWVLIFLKNKKHLCYKTLKLNKKNPNYLIFVKILKK